MAAITEPVALAFMDQHLRPLSELLRELEARVEDMEAAWFAGVNGTLTGTDTVENRVSEGVPSMTGNDATNTVVALMAARDAVTGTPGRAALLELASVRPLQVS